MPRTKNSKHVSDIAAALPVPRRISIAGESGCGKTTMALELAEALDAQVLHQDDYFLFPPKENAARRRRDLSWVGRGEVDLERLQADFDAHEAATLIVEGTYVTRLDGIDLRVFIELDYRATEAARIARARDPIDEHTNRILAIEHEIIRRDLPLADVVVRR